MTTQSNDCFSHFDQGYNNQSEVQDQNIIVFMIKVLKSSKSVFVLYNSYFFFICIFRFSALQFSRGFAGIRNQYELWSLGFRLYPLLHVHWYLHSYMHMHTSLFMH